MIRHTVFFSFKGIVPEEDIAALLHEYTTFPETFPSMRNFTLGANISQRDTTFSHAFSVDFDDELALTTYLNSPEHEDHVVNRFRPVISVRAIVSYVVNPGHVTTLDV